MKEDIERLGADLLKKKPGRPKKKEEKEQPQVVPSTSTKIWVVQSVLGVESAFINREDLVEYARTHKRVGLNTIVWLVENGVSNQAGHISEFWK